MVRFHGTTTTTLVSVPGGLQSRIYWSWWRGIYYRKIRLLSLIQQCQGTNGEKLWNGFKNLVSNFRKIIDEERKFCVPCVIYLTAALTQHCCSCAKMKFPDVRLNYESLFHAKLNGKNITHLWFLISGPEPSSFWYLKISPVGDVTVDFPWVTLTLVPAIRHTIVHQSSTSTYVPNFIEIGRKFFLKVTTEVLVEFRVTWASEWVSEWVIDLMRRQNVHKVTHSRTCCSSDECRLLTSTLLSQSHHSRLLFSIC